MTYKAVGLVFTGLRFAICGLNGVNRDSESGSSKRTGGLLVCSFPSLLGAVEV